MENQKIRCAWAGSEDDFYQQYHDQEWGKLDLRENYLYEMLVLESFQSGLSWRIILNKRANFRKAFAEFDPEKVALFDQADLNRLLADAGIVRNKMKIEAAINNARVISQMHQTGSSLSQLLQTEFPEVIMHHPKTDRDVPSQDENSQKLAKRFKKMGFKFLGPVTLYSFLQAVGIINDHIDTCQFK